MLRAGLVSLSFLAACSAHACTGSVYPLDRTFSYTTYPDTRGVLMRQAAGSVRYSNCPNRLFDATVRLDMPGLTYVGELSYAGRVMPAYEAAPDSALIGFTYQQVVGWDEIPLQNGAECVYEVDIDGSGGAQFSPQVYVFSRGGRMRTFETTGTVDVTVAAEPSLDVAMPVRIRIEFPAVTCPLQDKSEILQDVNTAEFSGLGSTAREKRVVIRMDCGVDAPRAKITLIDAGDAANTGSQLTPSSDSIAEGVRVQLLRQGREVQFGQAWDFDPGTGGAHDHEFTARYIRAGGALVPGLIKGEAVLKVDYW